MIQQQIQEDGINFIVEDGAELWRVKTLLTKEAGTIRWLQATLRPGDVFLDVGANIGLYTLYAARLVGPTGAVYAIEPHVVNARSLLRNITQNAHLEATIGVLTCAVAGEQCWAEFNYASLRPGSSGSQLGHVRGENGQEFQPAAVEVKRAVPLDVLVGERVLPPPHVVKIDVDGNEAEILRGMLGLIADQPPRSIQVEVHPTTLGEIDALMNKCGWALVERHHTANGKTRLEAGADPLTVPHNAIYQPKEESYGTDI
jgi:FkbM family methyltransferase